MEKYGLIIGNDFSEALIIAEDIETQERIILFDGCKHGYNAMFCDEYSQDELKRNGFDCLFINVYNEKGEKIEIAEFELA